MEGRMKNILLFSMIVFFGLVGIRLAHAQNVTSDNIASLESQVNDDIARADDAQSKMQAENAIIAQHQEIITEHQAKYADDDAEYTKQEMYIGNAQQFLSQLNQTNGT